MYTSVYVTHANNGEMYISMRQEEYFFQMNYVGIFLTLRLVQVLTLFQSWFTLSTNPKANGVIRGTSLSKL